MMNKNIICTCILKNLLKIFYIFILKSFKNKNYTIYIYLIMIEQYFFSEKNFKLIMSVLYERFSIKHNYFVGDDEEKLVIQLMNMAFKQTHKEKNETLKDYLIRLNRLVLNKCVEIIEKQLEEEKLQKKANMKKDEIINTFEEMKKNREPISEEKQKQVLQNIQEELEIDNKDIIENFEKLNMNREEEKKRIQIELLENPDGKEFKQNQFSEKLDYSTINDNAPKPSGADMLIQQPKEFKKLVENSFNNNNYIKEEYLLIDSRDRNQTVYPNPNNYQIDLTEEYKDIKSVSLISSNVPKSQYLINTSNNILNFVDSNSNEFEVQIPVGNYTISELTTQLQSSLNLIGSNNTFTVNADSKTNKVTISSSAGFQLLFNGGTENYNNSTRNIYKENSIGKTLGFSMTDLIGLTSYTSQNQYNLNGPTYVLLHINELNNLDGIQSSIKNAFAKIPLDTNQNEYKFFKESNDYIVITEFNPPLARLAELNIRFLNYDNTDYDFGGLDHTFLLKIRRLNQSQGYFIN